MLFVYGVVPAIAVSVIGSLATYFNWGVLFCTLPFLIEILVLHWAIKNRTNPVYLGILYWSSVGGVIAGLEVFLFSDFSLLTKYSVTIKYVINGFLNVLIGYLIAQYVISKTMRSRLAINRQRISVLLTNQLFLILTISVLAISLFWLKAIEREKLLDYQQLMQVKANFIANELETYTTSLQSALLVSALNNRNVSNASQIQKSLQHLKDNHPAMLTLLSTDSNGNVIATAPKNLLNEIQVSGNTSVADRSYFYEVKEKQTPFISDVFRGRGFGNDPLIALSVPLIGDAGFLGVIETSLNLELLRHLDRKEISPKEGLIILDQNDNVIYASEELNYAFLQNLSELSFVKSAPDPKKVQSDLSHGLIIQSSTSDSLNWKIITTLPRSVYDTGITVYLAITLTLLVLFILLGFVLVRWVVRIVSEPINTLSKALSEAQRAEDLLNLDLSGNNYELLEIATVKKTLNEFATRSKQLMSDLEKANINQDAANAQLLNLNTNLEAIVAVKTKELNNALVEANEAGQAKDEARNVAEAATRVKTEFLATMSHEIRTPMNGVLGMAELLNYTSLTTTQKEYVDTILNSGTVLLTIIDDILDFSKLEAGKVELEVIPIDLEKLLHEILAMMGRSITKNIELVLDYPATIPSTYMGDPARLSQVLYNLVGNAIKFTEEGSITVLARFDNQTLTIEVQDTGIGITPEQQKYLFESFNQADATTTRKYGGTGLGLAISKNLIDLMEGKISIKSEFGTGTSFTISLNLPAETVPPTQSSLRGLNILILEERESQFEMHSNLLEHHGANVYRCSAIELLINRLLAYDDDNLSMDLILFSSNLSTEQEQDYGVQLSNHPTLSRIPVVVLSASTRNSDLEHYSNACFSAAFTKPVLNEELITALKESTASRDSDALISKHSLSTIVPKPSLKNCQFKGDILLAEDVLTNQIIAQTMLSKMGLTVDIAMDGVQAVEKWQNKHYDLIFMDCRMPNMDGYEATHEIRSQETENQQIPIIALTANATEKDRLKCLAVGMNELVTKPYKPEDLMQVLSKWLTPPSAIDTVSNHNEMAIIDHDAFKETQAYLGDGFVELVNSIFHDMDTMLTKLANWRDLTDVEGFIILPHSLKSSSAYIGAQKLNKLAKECEDVAATGNVEKALSFVGDMLAAHDDVIKELKALGFTKPL